MFHHILLFRPMKIRAYEIYFANNFVYNKNKTMIPDFLFSFIIAKPKIAGNDKEFSFVHVYKGSAETQLVCEVEEANPFVIDFTWEAQLSGCTNTDCKPNNSNWQTVTGTENGFRIASLGGKSTITLKESEQHFFYRCTASNDVGKAYREWKVVPVKGNYL